jgi:hypothetical protein
MHRVVEVGRRQEEEKAGGNAGSRDIIVAYVADDGPQVRVLTSICMGHYGRHKCCLKGLDAAWIDVQGNVGRQKT